MLPWMLPLVTLLKTLPLCSLLGNLPAFDVYEENPVAPVQLHSRLVFKYLQGTLPRTGGIITEGEEVISGKESGRAAE